jgi:hypothetical protein
LLECLAGSDRLTDRKLRLLACACVRRVWPLMADETARRAVLLAEGHADGLVGDADLDAVGREMVAVGNAALRGPESISQALGAAAYLAEADTAWATDQALLAAAEAVSCAAVESHDPNDSSAVWRPAWDAEAGEQCRLVRDLFVNPLSPLPAVEKGWLAWNAGTVRRLAEAAYQERQLPQGTLDGGRLSILADALEEAGCTDANVLGHLRWPGPHWRDCWALDVILARS